RRFLVALQHEPGRSSDPKQRNRERFMSTLSWTTRAAMLAAAALALSSIAAAGEKTVKAVMHSDLKILDPIWTTAYIQRNHGYMVWDTLFAMDEKLEVKPQMVERYSVSADGLTYAFTLREGLRW